MKVGVLTYHHACNYGAYLQACALCSRLNQEQGVDAEIIDYRMAKEAEYYSSKFWSIKRKILHFREYLFTMKVYKAFERADWKTGKARKSEGFLVSDNQSEFKDFVNKKYDVIVAGSDEIWNTKSFRGFPTPYWLPDDLGAHKFSYAASSRVDFSKMGQEQQNKVKELLSDFEFIGVRDDITYNQVSSLIDSQKVYMCCDPSFLYDFEVAETIPNKITQAKGFDQSKKTVFIMTENNALADKIVSISKGRYNLVSVFHWHKGCINVADLDPEEWLQTINSVDMVMASYFHAICFSIMRRKPFLALETPGKSSKLMDLLGDTCFEENFIRDAVNVLDESSIEKAISSKRENSYYDEFIGEKRSTFTRFADELKKYQE